MLQLQTYLFVRTKINNDIIFDSWKLNTRYSQSVIREISMFYIIIIMSADGAPAVRGIFEGSV